MAVTRPRSKTDGPGKQPVSNKTFPLGSPVKVPFGKRTFDARVVENHKGRVTVEITIEGASEPLVTSYRWDEVKEA